MPIIGFWEVGGPQMMQCWGYWSLARKYGLIGKRSVSAGRSGMHYGIMQNGETDSPKALQSFF